MYAFAHLARDAGSAWWAKARSAVLRREVCSAPLPTLVWGLKSQEVILGYVICLSSLISFLVRPRRFFVPTAIWQERRAQTRSSLAKGHRRRRREAGLTASSTARALRGRAIGRDLSRRHDPGLGRVRRMRQQHRITLYPVRARVARYPNLSCTGEGKAQ